MTNTTTATDRLAEIIAAVAELQDAGYELRPVPGYDLRTVEQLVVDRWGSDDAHAAAMVRVLRRTGYIDLSPITGDVWELQSDVPDSELEEAVWTAASAWADLRTAPYAWLYDYDTAERIRPATADELAASIAAAERDGGAGVIEIDGRRCYAQS